MATGGYHGYRAFHCSSVGSCRGNDFKGAIFMVDFCISAEMCVTGVIECGIVGCTRETLSLSHLPRLGHSRPFSTHLI